MKFFPGGSIGKESLAMQETQVQFLGWEDPLEERMKIHSSILAWRILWTRGASRTTVHRVAKSLTLLKWLSMHAHTGPWNDHHNGWHKHTHHFQKPSPFSRTSGGWVHPPPAPAAPCGGDDRISHAMLPSDVCLSVSLTRPWLSEVWHVMSYSLFCFQGPAVSPEQCLNDFMNYTTLSHMNI